MTQDRTILRKLYAPPAGRFVMVDVPELPFAIVDGEGPPLQSSIEVAVKALYTAIYAIRCEARERMGRSFVQAPVELLYWADDMRDLAAGNREKWHWRVQITLPVWTDAQSLKDSSAKMRHELGDIPAARWEVLAEGKCVQLLHVGQRVSTATTCHKPVLSQTGPTTRYILTIGAAVRRRSVRSSFDSRCARRSRRKRAQASARRRPSAALQLRVPESQGYGRRLWGCNTSELPESQKLA